MNLLGLYVWMWVTPEWRSKYPFQVIDGRERYSFIMKGWQGCSQYGPSEERSVLVRVGFPLQSDPPMLFSRCRRCPWCLAMAWDEQQSEEPINATYNQTDVNQ